MYAGYTVITIKICYNWLALCANYLFTDHKTGQDNTERADR